MNGVLGPLSYHPLTSRALSLALVQCTVGRFKEISRRYRLKVKVLVTQLCPTLCSPRDCSPPGSSVHGILQARILEWVAIPFSRGSSQPRDQSRVYCIASKVFTVWTIKEALAIGQSCCSLSKEHLPHLHPLP